MNFVANLPRNPGAFLFSGGSRGGPAPPPLIFRPNWEPKSPKNLGGTAPPPSTPGPGLLSQGLNPAPLLHDSY